MGASAGALKGIIASGAQREAYVLRLLMDWIGPRGDVRKLGVRNTASTYEGDMMRFTGHSRGEIAHG